MDEVWSGEFCNEGGYDVEEEDDCFWDCGTDEVEGAGEDDYVEDVVY